MSLEAARRNGEVLLFLTLSFMNVWKSYGLLLLFLGIKLTRTMLLPCHNMDCCSIKQLLLSLSKTKVLAAM